MMLSPGGRLCGAVFICVKYNFALCWYLKISTKYGAFSTTCMSENRLNKICFVEIFVNFLSFSLEKEGLENGARVDFQHLWLSVQQG
jgi:hypothetical protein